MNNFPLDNEVLDMVTFLTMTSYNCNYYPDELNAKIYYDPISHLNMTKLEFSDHDVFVISGTQCLFDWIADAKLIFGITPRQFKKAVKFMRTHVNNDKPTIISGHSLGGGITQFIIHELNMDNLIGVTFNGVGIKHLIKERDRYEIYNVMSSRDILNGITKRLPFSYFKHIGWEYEVEDTESKNCIRAHSNFGLFM